MQNGVNCFIADTSELTADSINWLLNDEVLARSMGKIVQKRVKEKYDSNTTVRKLERVLQEVISV